MREADGPSQFKTRSLRIMPIPASHTDSAVRDSGTREPASGDSAPGSGPRRSWQRLALTVGSLAVLWGGLTGWAPASWVFGGPIVIAATALAFRFAPAPAWRLSPLGAVRFAGWFLVNSLRSGLSVAGRALGWHVTLKPGFRIYRTSLPPGPARICFANVISLLPGTLSVEVAGDRIEVHMLDTATGWEAELAELEARIRTLFALPEPGVAPRDSHSAFASAKIEDIA
jgi:multicomponent Na+:H+ antiporter subunit E